MKEEFRVDTHRLGLAGEFRVMSELLLTGYNPAKSYLNDGADIILSDGTRIEVKTVHLDKGKYTIHLSNHDFDFLVVWCIDENSFYILPAWEIPFHSVHVPYRPFYKYKNAWDVLRIPKYRKEG